MKMMKQKTMLKMVGATLAVCSAVTMMQGGKIGSGATKKAVKKTANRVADIVDSISAFM